jgi:hypothetical protein
LFSILTLLSRSSDEDLRAKQLEQKILEGKKRREAIRSERTRSLSPEKKQSIGIKHTIDLPSPATPYLNSKAILTAKELEIKKTIEAIAGPTGTLPLFPQNSKPVTDNSLVKSVSEKTTPQAQRLESYVKQPPKQPSKLDKPLITKSAPKNEEPLYSLSKKAIPAKPVKPQETEQPIYTLPKRAAIASSFVQSKPPVEETPDYSLSKRNLILPSIAKSTKKDEPVFKESERSTKLANKFDKIEKPAKPEKPKFGVGKTEQPSVAKKKVDFAKNSDDEPTFKKKPAPPIFGDKPSTLSPAKQMDYEDFKKKFDERNPIKPKDEDNKLKLLQEATIISSKPSTTTGLKKFKPTSEHNIHNQVFSALNDHAPLPGMAPRHSISSPASPRPISLPKSQSSYTIGSTLNSHSPSPPKGSFLASRLQPNFATQMLDMPPKPHASPPPGSFLASRSSSPVSLSHSPVRGGFIQSAMLKKEGNNHSRAGSTDSLHSLNSFSDISLVNPIGRTSSRTPSPIRIHGRAKSATSIDNGAGFKKNSISEKNDKVSKSLNFGSIDLSKPRPIEHFHDETNGRDDDNSIRRDSRRWSPNRPSWLENAINKSPSMSGIDSFNRASPHFPNSRPTSVSFKPVAPAKPLPPRKPASVALSEPSLTDDDDESESADVSKLLPVPDSRSVSTLGRSNTVKPAPPSVGSKPSADALEKLRLLRARASNNSAPESPAKTPPAEEEEKVASQLPPRSKSTPLLFEVKPRPRPPISRGIKPQPRTPFPAVPPSLVPKARPVNAEIPVEPLIMKYHPTEEDDGTLENASIPSVISKKTAHSFASDLSAVLKRGKPLVALEETNTSFSPRFERLTGFSGPKKSHTFDSSVLSSSSSNRTLQSKQEKLTHITKNRAKGPKRRLPKASTLPATASVKTHTCQRSRSLSPKSSQQRSFVSSSAEVSKFSVRSFKPTVEPSNSFQVAASAFKPPADPVISAKPIPSSVNSLAKPVFSSGAGKFNAFKPPADTLVSSKPLSFVPSTDPASSPLSKAKSSETNANGRVKPLIKTPSRAVSINSTASKPIPVPPKPKSLSMNADSE